MLEFARRIQWIDVDLRSSSPNDAKEGYWKSNQVGHHHRDAIALFHTEFSLEIGGKIARLAIHVSVGQSLPEGSECRLVCVLLHRHFEHMNDRAMHVRVNLSGNTAFTVCCKPWPLRHFRNPFVNHLVDRSIDIDAITESASHRFPGALAEL